MRIPDDILARFEEKTEGLQFGAVTLTVFFNPKTGKPRFVINQETSILSEEDEHNNNHDSDQVEKAKEFMRSKHPEGVRIFDIAQYVGCSQSRAARIIDLLSKGTDFLVYMDDEKRPTHYFIDKDVEKEKVGANR